MLTIIGPGLSFYLYLIQTSEADLNKTMSYDYDKKKRTHFFDLFYHIHKQVSKGGLGGAGILREAGGYLEGPVGTRGAQGVCRKKARRELAAWSPRGDRWVPGKA